MTLGEKIQWGRRRRGLSQQQLGEKLCVSRSAIAKWETDKGLPDVDNLRQLSRLLGMTVDNLLSADTAAVLEPCSFDDLPGCRRVQKDSFMRQRFPDSAVIPLLGRAVDDNADRSPTPMSLYLGSRTQRQLAFYLVETAQEQLFVTVTDELLELRPMEETAKGESFYLNGWHFLRLHPI